jgi:hypothetical protein
VHFFLLEPRERYFFWVAQYQFLHTHKKKLDLQTNPAIRRTILDVYKGIKLTFKIRCQAAFAPFSLPMERQADLAVVVVIRFLAGGDVHVEEASATSNSASPCTCLSTHRWSRNTCDSGAWSSPAAATALAAPTTCAHRRRRTWAPDPRPAWCWRRRRPRARRRGPPRGSCGGAGGRLRRRAPPDAPPRRRRGPVPRRG